jgi:feruloyl-CoA hydratase/lyase
MTVGSWETVRVSLEDGIAWVELNRPEKRNAMSPTLNGEMIQVLETLDAEDACGVVVLTGAGEAFSAGMDLKEYFREVDKAPEHVQRKVRRDAALWQWRLLRNYAKPTIAMVNGYCFGGAFTPLCACDFAIAADEAIFGLSEVNWGILPGGIVSWNVTQLMSYRDAMYYACTGETFTGKQASEMRLVNFSVPRAQLRAETIKFASILLTKSPAAIRYTKECIRAVRNMDVAQAADYLNAKSDALRLRDPEKGRAEATKQFLDEKSFKPGLGGYRRKTG